MGEILNIIKELLQKISETSITIGGYVIYLPLIIIVVAVILFIMILLSIISRSVKKKRRRAEATLYDNYCAITEWQRKAIPYILNNHGTLEENAYIVKYMENNDVWYTDEILDVDKDIVNRVDVELFNEIRQNIQEDSYCFLLCNTIDKLNGGLDFTDQGYDPWISDRISDSSEIDNRFKACVLAALNNMLGHQDVFPLELLEKTGQSVADNDLYEYSDNDYAILKVAFIMYIADFYISNDLDDIGLSYIRVLASLFDRRDYLIGLKSVEV